MTASQRMFEFVQRCARPQARVRPDQCCVCLRDEAYPGMCAIHQLEEVRAKARSLMADYFGMPGVVFENKPDCAECGVNAGEPTPATQARCGACGRGM